MSQEPWNAWQSPQAPVAPAAERQTPAVWPWFVAYALLMALVYLLVLGLGILLVALPAFVAEVPEEDKIVFPLIGMIYIPLGLVLALLFGAAPFLPKRPWVWIYDLVLIAIGMTSACCWPIVIPLLIFWIKPETKAFFGRS